MQDNLLEVMTKYRETDVKIIKTNLKNACVELKDYYGTRQELSELTGIKFNSLQSCLNVSHASTLTFENLIKICGVLGVNVSDMFRDTKIVTRINKGEKMWTPENKQDLINRYLSGGIELVQKKFKLTNKTVLHYYNIFSKEI